MKRTLFIAIIFLLLSALAYFAWTKYTSRAENSRDLVGTVNNLSLYVLPTTVEQHRAQQSIFEFNGDKIAYTDHGAGSTIVLLHGVPTSSWMYRKLIPLLQPFHRIITIDLLGFGSSDKPEAHDQNYTPENQANRVIALLRQLELEEYSLLLHDMGALVGWEMLRQKEAVSQLVILNSIIRQEGFLNPEFDKNMATRIMSYAYSDSMTSSMMLSNTFKELGMSTEATFTEEECRGYVLPMTEGADHAMFEFFTSLNDSLFSRLEQNKRVFEEFQGGALVLWGAEDPILTTAQIPFLKEHLRLNDDDVHLFENNNHFLAEEVPDEISARILEFLSK